MAYPLQHRLQWLRSSFPVRGACNEKKNQSLMLFLLVQGAKLKVIKVVREITGLGPQRSKRISRQCSKSSKRRYRKEEAEEIKAKLEEVGARYQNQMSSGHKITPPGFYRVPFLKNTYTHMDYYNTNTT